MSNLNKITDELWAIGIPIDSYEFSTEIDFEDDWFKLIFHHDITDEESGFYGECCEYDIDLPKGNYEVLGTVSETEIDFDTSECVEYKISGKVLGNCKLYKIYTSGNWSFFSHNSFRSLLKSKGITPTPKTKIVILKNI